MRNPTRVGCQNNHTFCEECVNSVYLASDDEPVQVRSPTATSQNTTTNTITSETAVTTETDTTDASNTNNANNSNNESKTNDEENDASDVASTETNATCPLCREKLARGKVESNNDMHLQIKALQVKCKYNSCTWQGFLGSFESHVQQCSKRPGALQTTNENGTQPRRFQIFIKDLANKSITIDNVSKHTPIAQIKQTFYEKEGIPVRQQKFSILFVFKIHDIHF